MHGDINFEGSEFEYPLNYIKPGSHWQRKHKQENKALIVALRLKTKEKEFIFELAFVLP